MGRSPFTPTPLPSPGECESSCEGAKPGEGKVFKEAGGRRPPRLLGFLHPLSATLRCVEDGFQAERGKG